MSGQSHQQITTSVLFMVAFAVFGPVIDTFAKLSTEAIPSAQIATARFVVQSIFLFVVVLMLGYSLRVDPRDTWRHVVRGVLIAAATMCFFTALKYMPIADAISIFFIEPMFLTLLGGLILNERVGWRRYLACAVGFVGAVIVIRPSFQETGWPALMPLGSAVMFACYLILTRSIARRTNPFVMQLYAGIAGAVFSIVILAIFQGSGSATFDPVMPHGKYWGLLLGVGIAATIAHLFLVSAFARAPASILAPFQYLEIVTATLLGYWIFDDFPDAMKWLGICIIVSSGLFIFWRERQLAHA